MEGQKNLQEKRTPSNGKTWLLWEAHSTLCIPPPHDPHLQGGSLHDPFLPDETQSSSTKWTLLKVLQ